MFNLIWNNEVIDTADSKEEAAFLVAEYEMAYGGTVAVEEADEDDGQPDSYTEYQDLYGGDDAFETCSYAEDF